MGRFFIFLKLNYGYPPIESTHAIVKGGLSLSSFIGREREEWIVTFGKQDFNLK